MTERRKWWIVAVVFAAAGVALLVGWLIWGSRSLPGAALAAPVFTMSLFALLSATRRWDLKPSSTSVLWRRLVTLLVLGAVVFMLLFWVTYAVRG